MPKLKPMNAGQRWFLDRGKRGFTDRVNVTLAPSVSMQMLRGLVRRGLMTERNGIFRTTPVGVHALENAPR